MLSDTTCFLTGILCSKVFSQGIVVDQASPEMFLLSSPQLLLCRLPLPLSNSILGGAILRDNLRSSFASFSSGYSVKKFTFDDMINGNVSVGIEEGSSASLLTFCETSLEFAELVPH